MIDILESGKKVNPAKTAEDTGSKDKEKKSLRRATEQSKSSDRLFTFFNGENP